MEPIRRGNCEIVSGSRNMDIFKFRGGLRRALLEQVDEIQNANGWYRWDTTRRGRFYCLSLLL